MSLAAVVGILLNLCIPANKTSKQIEEEKKQKETKKAEKAKEKMKV